MVTDMQYLFAECYSLKSINFSNWDTSSLENVESMFYSCSSLEYVDLSGFNTPSLINMDSMFFDCTSLKSIDLSSFDTSNVEIMKFVFHNCASLKYANLSNWVTSSVTTMMNLFSDCVNLTAVEIPNFFMEQLISYDDIFLNVNKLKYINIKNMKYKSSQETCSTSDECNWPSNLQNTPLYVCQTNKFINIENMHEICCSFNVETGMCESNNYISLYFNQDCVYENGFFNIYRNISFINYENTTINDNNKLNIISGTKLEIHFNYGITTMEKFFAKEEDNNMIYLVSIDLSHFDSSSVTNMDSMFSGCSSLKWINLLNLNTLKVTNMASMFEGCKSLNSIDLSEFVTSNVKNMNSMFAQCISLKELNLSNFDTSSVTWMDYMFYNCTSLSFLDISNFNLQQVTGNEQMLNLLKNLNYINLYNVQDNGHILENALDFNSIIENILYVCQKFNIITNTKSFNCCEYRNNPTYCDNKLSAIHSTEITNILTTQNIYTTIITPNIPTTPMTSNIPTTINKANTPTTSIKSTIHTTPPTSNAVIIPTTQTISTINNIQNNNIPNTQNSSNIFNTSNISKDQNITKEIEDIYNNIRQNLKDQTYQIIETQNSILHFSTVGDQLNNNSKRISSIDLGECESKLREQEGLNETEEFLMIKLDIKNSSINGTFVQYEIFNPRNYSKVSLEICKNISIKIQVPVELKESHLSLISSLEDSGYNIFDITDDFYNDICSTYTAQNGADMTLSSRKTNIYDSIKDIYLCQEGCEFESFDTDTSKAECSCKVQENEIITDESQISFEKNDFFDSFYNTLYNSNFRVFNCFKLIFSLKGMKKNYGSYIMSLLSTIFISCIIVHSFKGMTKIFNIIDSINKSKFKVKKGENNKIPKIQDEKNDIIIRKNSKRKSKKKHSTKKSSKRHSNKTVNLQAPLKKSSSRNSMLTRDIHIIKLNDNSNNTKELINKKPPDVKRGSKKEEQINQYVLENEKENDILEQYKNITEPEMNTLEYEEAIIIDKRTFCQYYFSLLKREHLIVFTFYTKDDYNLPQIKILLFLVSFSLFFTINAFFFSDGTMDQIYEDNGVFNFIYQLPQILYSSLISSIINIILRKLAISEGQILDLKKEKDNEKKKQKLKSIKNILKIKLIIFLVFSSLLMLFFWYFISCFCAAYKNTQIILIEDTLISFITSMMYPIGLKLLPGMVRIPALKAPNKDKKYNYKISRILNLL